MEVQETEMAWQGGYALASALNATIRTVRCKDSYAWKTWASDGSRLFTRYLPFGALMTLHTPSRVVYTLQSDAVNRTVVGLIRPSCPESLRGV